jgi:hypothetical protein
MKTAKKLLIVLGLSSLLLGTAAQAAIWQPLPPWCKEGQDPKKDNCRNGSDSGALHLTLDECKEKESRGCSRRELMARTPKKSPKPQPKPQPTTNPDDEIPDQGAPKDTFGGSTRLVVAMPNGQTINL